MRRKPHGRFGRGPTEQCFANAEQLAGGLPYSAVKDVLRGSPLGRQVNTQGSHYF